MMLPVLESILTCPNCGFAKQETMPTDACQFFYECTNCGALLRPNSGGLLRFLLLRFGEMPSNSSAALLLRR